MSALRVQVADLQYLSARAIRRETHRSDAWVKTHMPLMRGCDYTPAGWPRVPRDCVHEFITEHTPGTCSACMQTADAGKASAASAR